MTAAVSLLAFESPCVRPRCAAAARDGFGASAPRRRCRIALRLIARGDQWSDRIAAIASRGDRAAFAELFAYFAPRVKAYLQRTGTGEAQVRGTGAGDDARGLAQGGLFDPGSASAATWIFTIARNLRIDACGASGGAARPESTRSKRNSIVDEAPLRRSRVPTAEAERRVRKALKKLPADQLRVIEMSFFEETAAWRNRPRAGFPLGTVKSRVRLAMGRLRGLLDDCDDHRASPRRRTARGLCRGRARSRTACGDRDPSGGLRSVPGWVRAMEQRRRRADCRCAPCRARADGALDRCLRGSHGRRRPRPQRARRSCRTRRGHCRASSSAMSSGRGDGSRRASHAADPSARARLRRGSSC